MQKSKTKNMTTAAVIAASYTVLTLLSALCGLSSGIIQIRISEALCVLPFFTPAAIPGLCIGCFLSDIICGGVVLDAVFGSIATLIGAISAYYLGKIAKTRGSLILKFAVPFPNVLANTLIIPWVLRFVYGEAGSVLFFTVTVGAGEIISSVILGLPLLFALAKRKNLFR